MGISNPVSTTNPIVLLYILGGRALCVSMVTAIGSGRRYYTFIISTTADTSNVKNRLTKVRTIPRRVNGAAQHIGRARMTSYQPASWPRV